MDGSQPAEISKVAVRLPPFWAERPAVWFAQAEEQFSLAGISSERTKLHYIISQLDQRYAAEVEDIISSLPQQDPYTELLKRLSLSREQRAHRILTLEEMGDRKPSQFLRNLRNLAPDLPDYFLQAIWTSRLPAKVQAIQRWSWTPQPTALTASSRQFPRPRSPALANQHTTTRF
jgi:hypothetical protein